MASSHAGTRLPIAAFWPGCRALPLRPARDKNPERHSVFAPAQPPFRYRGKQTPPDKEASKSISSLRRHCPNQVKGRSVRFLSAGGSPVLSPILSHRRLRLSRAAEAVNKRRRTRRLNAAHKYVGRMRRLFVQISVFTNDRFWCYTWFVETDD